MTGNIKRNMDSPSSKKTLEERKLRVVVLLVMSLKLRYLYLWGISQGIVYYNGQNLPINTQNYSPWFSWVRKYLAFFMNKLPLNKVENRWLAKLTVSEGDGGYFFNSKYLLIFSFSVCVSWNCLFIQVFFVPQKVSSYCLSRIVMNFHSFWIKADNTSLYQREVKKDLFLRSLGKIKALKQKKN